MITFRVQRYATIAILSLSLILYLLWSQFFIHDWYLWRFSHSYANITHPPSTRHLKSYKDLGLLIANGNHVDLFVGELRSFIGPQQKVTNWYSSKSVPSQITKGDRVPVEVVFINDGKISSGEIGIDRPYLLKDILQEMNTLAPPATHCYIVYVLDVGLDPGIDVRGM